MARETNDCHVTIILAGAAELLVFTFPKVFAWIFADLYAALSGKYFVFCNGACDVQIANVQVKTEELEENVHYEYLQKFYGEGQERYVVDEQGNDVTKIFFDKTLNMFQQGNTEEIFQIMELGKYLRIIFRLVQMW